MPQIVWSPSLLTRHRIYAAVAGAFFLLAVAIAFGKAILRSQPFELPISDGRYYYAYLPSAVIDGDLDFANQVSEHWGSAFHQDLLENRTKTGSVRNKYTIGLALTLLPGFLTGHVIALFSAGTIPADGYTWPYQLACLAIIELLVWRTLVGVDRLMTDRLHMPANATFPGLLLLAIATPYAYYAFREPFMVHAVSAFWCTQVAVIAAAGHRGPEWLWPRLAFCGAMAVVCRPTNLHLAPLVIYGAVQAIQSAGFRRTLISLPLAGTAIVPIGLQLLTWHLQSGSWIYYSYIGESFNWTQPALWQTLFSSRHGLFFWSPVFLLAVAGLVLRARDTIVQCWFFGAVLLWYANSAWQTWWFGDSFGARAFLELFGLFGIGLGLTFESLRNKPRLSGALIALTLAFNTLVMAFYITHHIPHDGYLLP
jgi:hypothetical protein